VNRVAQELEHERAADEDGHRAVEGQVLPAALGALELEPPGGRVVVDAPMLELLALALVVVAA
jgi:hypothetical protein